ncbi:MAG: hypothetical protein NT159_08250 [Proteobacteria bacterium]|nr:hypothetical protein [Pseudomonadota bacterium]
MKAIVEFGIPKSALRHPAPCGLDSGSGIPFDSAALAAKAAAKIAHVLMKREEAYLPERFRVSRTQPRVTLWNRNRSAWICVSLLDGNPRGSFGGSPEARQGGH